jgi:hypothetical protein
MAVGWEFNYSNWPDYHDQVHGFLVLLTKSSAHMMMVLLHSTQEPTQSQAQTPSLCGS